MPAVLRIDGELLSTTPFLPEWVDVRVLAGGAAETYTGPAAGNVLHIVPTVTPLYVNTNGTAAVPGADVTDGSGSFPVTGPYWIRVRAGDAISMLCASACVVGIGVYSKSDVRP